MGKDIKEFFLNPTHITHRKYEVLRALCIDKIKAKDVAERFGYSLFSINAMKRDFVNAVKKLVVDIETVANDVIDVVQDTNKGVQSNDDDVEIDI